MSEDIINDEDFETLDLNDDEGDGTSFLSLARSTGSVNKPEEKAEYTERGTEVQPESFEGSQDRDERYVQREDYVRPEQPEEGEYYSGEEEYYSEEEEYYPDGNEYYPEGPEESSGNYEEEPQGAQYGDGYTEQGQAVIGNDGPGVNMPQGAAYAEPQSVDRQEALNTILNQGVEQQEAFEEDREERKAHSVDDYKRKRRRKAFIRTIVILAIIAIIVLLVYLLVIKPKIEEADMMFGGFGQQTDTIERRDIVESISTTGTIEASETRTLTSTAKDTTIESVQAEVGDIVYNGQTLVMFSTESINKTISQLQEDLATQRKKDDIESKSQDRNYLYTYSAQATELYNASEKVQNALKNLYEACDGYGDAKRERQKAIDEDTYVEGGILDQNVSSAYQKEQQAQQEYDAAVEQQTQLVAKCNNTLTEADENRETQELTSGEKATSLARQIEDYQDKLDSYVISSPINGVVTSVSVEEGNGFSGGNVMVIQNTDSFKITANIDEYDIPDIKVGQHVAIKTDATRDDELEGVVSFVAPTSTSTANGNSSSGSNNSVMSSSSSGASYEVTIDVISKDERLRIGMSAKLSIIIDEVSDVLTVPYDAISIDAEGNSIITVVEDGGDFGIPVSGEDFDRGGSPSGGLFSGLSGLFGSKEEPEMSMQNTRDIVVTVGMEGDYYSQIISNEIHEGMTVLVTEHSDIDPFDMYFDDGFY